MSNLQNINDITKGAIAVICSQVLPKVEEGLTVSQAAQMLGMSTSKLNQMRHTKTGPQSYREGVNIFYKPSSIEAYISQTNEINSKKRRAA